MGASYRSTALIDVFTAARLGASGIAALIDTHRGGVQALAGIAALRPRLNLVDTPLYAAMQGRPDGGIWIGATSIDSIIRIHAFRSVPGRDLIVLAGMELGEAMAPADSWALGARSVAIAATLLVLLVGATALWQLWHLRSGRRRQRAMEHAEFQLEAVRTDLLGTRMRANIAAAQLRAALVGVRDGVAVFDGELRLAVWNTPFIATSGVPPEMLHEGLSLDSILRHQAHAGQYGVLEDVEAEVSGRIALLRPESGHAELTQLGPDGTALTIRSQLTPDGGLVLTVNRQNPVPRTDSPPPAAEVQPATEATEW